jgi:hypothetical protein
MDFTKKPLVAEVQDYIVAKCAPWATALNINVAIGRRDDTKTWRLDLAPEVTPAQRKKARKALRDFIKERAKAATDNA